MMRVLKILLVLVLLWSIPVCTNSQDLYTPGSSTHQYAIWFNNLPARSVEYYLQDLYKFIHQLETKQPRFKDQTDFLRYVYYKVHRKYLREYRSPSTMADLFEDGTYDCLTGTALYAIILEKLGIDHSIVETTFHVFLTASIDNRMVLIESTSPLDGFIADSELINTTLVSYRQDHENKVWARQDYYKPLQPVHNRVSITELAGLQFYNQAVAAYNSHDLESALLNLSNALKYYPSPRLKEMMVVMLNTLDQEDNIDPLIKDEYLSRYRHLRHPTITAYQVN